MAKTNRQPRFRKAFRTNIDWQNRYSLEDFLIGTLKGGFRLGPFMRNSFEVAPYLMVYAYPDEWLLLKIKYGEGLSKFENGRQP